MIIGITGTLGSGKGTVAEYLQKRHRFAYFSIRNFFAGEAVRRGLMVNHDSITKIAKDLRAEHGPTWVLEQLIQQAPKNQNIVIESVRFKDEVEYLKSKGAKLWAIDADIRTRYKRTVNRDMAVGSVSFDEFAAKDVKDTNLAKVLAMADLTLRSDGSREQLIGQVEEVLAKTTQKA